MNLLQLLVSLVVPLLALWAELSAAANVLAYLPFGAKSHHIVFDPLLRALAERGHHVTAYKSLSMSVKPSKNYKEIITPNFLEELKSKMKFNVVDFGKAGFISQLMGLNEIGYMVTDASLKSKDFQNLMTTREKFDLVLTEALFAQYSIAALAHRFGAHHIVLMPLGNSHWTNFVTANPYNPSYIPDYNSVSTWKMSYLERLQNTIKSALTVLITQFYFLPRFQAQTEEYFVYEGNASRPHLSDILLNTSLVIENSHLSLNGATPRAPNLVAVGGMHIGPNKPLPQTLKNWLSDCKDGVIYFSYGTVVQGGHLDDRVKQAFVSAFSKIPQRVLWKFDEKLDVPSNVMIESWVPQQDVLAHPNVVLFITHGGYLSINEAVNYAVPLVGTPFFGDQAKNMHEVTESGYGLRLDYDNVTQQSVLWAIKEILDNPKYKEAMTSKSSIFRDRQSSALETAVYWVEYVLKHDGAHHLKPYLASMSWYETALLDVAVVASLPLILLCLMVRKFYLFVTCQTWGRKKSAHEKKYKKT